MKQLLILAAFFAFSNAFAFEVGSFHSGMPFGEALSALKREGFTFDAEQTTSGVIFAFRDDSTHALSFCNGRLTSYRYSVAGGILIDTSSAI
jgi:hypothetical protein